jgi:hypothetical protein
MSKKKTPDVKVANSFATTHDARQVPVGTR